MVAARREGMLPRAASSPGELPTLTLSRAAPLPGARPGWCSPWMAPSLGRPHAPALPRAALSPACSWVLTISPHGELLLGYARGRSKYLDWCEP
jgi:hypothetical protein